MLKREALKIVGGISNTSKMPGKSYGLPARACITGSKLRKVKGSVCEKCFGCKGRYGFKTVQQAQERRLEATLNDPRWVEAMSLICSKEDWWRWHDTGDVQSLRHLRAIVAVARACPNTKFWLPTQERGMVSEFLLTETFPSNLVVRLSATKVGKAMATLLPVNTSSVGSGGGVCCPVQNGAQSCDDNPTQPNCRACWDKSVMNVDYRLH